MKKVCISIITLMIITVVFTFAQTQKLQPIFLTDNITKILMEGQIENLLQTNDLAVKIPIDTGYWQYDCIEITIHPYDKEFEMGATGSDWNISYYKDISDKNSKQSYSKYFAGNKELALWILNPNAPNKQGDFGMTAYGGYNYINTQYLLMGKISFGKTKYKTIAIAVIIKGWMQTGTKQKWDDSDQSWYTVPVWDDGEIIMENHDFIIHTPAKK